MSAAERDTSQAQIIEDAINLLENKVEAPSFGWDHKELAFLTNVELDVFKSNPSRKERVKKLDRSKIDISNTLISEWDSGLLENDS